MDVLEKMILMSHAIPKKIAMQMERNVMEFKMLAVSVRRGFARYHLVVAQEEHFFGPGAGLAMKIIVRMREPASGLAQDVY